MRRSSALALSLLLFGLLTGGECSRARVESLTEMNTGVALARTGRYVEGKQHLERAGTIDPTNDQAFANLGVVHIELGEWHLAAEAYQRAIDANPAVAGYYEKLGTARMQVEEWASAREALNAAIERDERLFKAYFKLAQVLERLDDPQGALEQYTAAIERGPRFMEAYIALGQLYADQGFPEQAVQVLTSGLGVAIDGTEQRARMYHMLGTVHQEQRSYDAAISAFREALEIVPGMPDALVSMGWCHSLNGNDEEAERYLQMFVASPGSDTPEHYVRAAQNRLEEIRR